MNPKNQCLKACGEGPRIALLLLAVLGLIFVGRAWADHGSDAVFKTFGYVRDNLGNPIVGIEAAGDNYIGDFYPSITDTNGYYEVLFPSDGNYRLQISCLQLTARGYGCVSAVALTQEGDPIRLDFTVAAAVASLHITNLSLPKGNVGAVYTVQLGAIGGRPPYAWQIASNSPSLPGGLSLDPSGLISGIPTTNSTTAFRVRVVDGDSVVTNRVLVVTINRQPVLLTPAWRTNRLSMRLFGAAEQNYTIQMSTNLSSTNWISLFVTNNSDASSYIVSDPHATNRARFYRVLVGP